MTTKKPAPDADDTPPPSDPIAAADTAAPEMPAEGGCYVRHPDGSLTRED